MSSVDLSISDTGEIEMMYEVILCLSAMCLSINLCVLLVSSAQFFFAVSGKETYVLNMIKDNTK